VAFQAMALRLVDLAGHGDEERPQPEDHAQEDRQLHRVAGAVVARAGRQSRHEQAGEPHELDDLDQGGGLVDRRGAGADAHIGPHRMRAARRPRRQRPQRHHEHRREQDRRERQALDAQEIAPQP